MMFIIIGRLVSDEVSVYWLIWLNLLCVVLMVLSICFLLIRLGQCLGSISSMFCYLLSICGNLLNRVNNCCQSSGSRIIRNSVSKLRNRLQISYMVNRCGIWKCFSMLIMFWIRKVIIIVVSIGVSILLKVRMMLKLSISMIVSIIVFLLEKQCCIQLCNILIIGNFELEW